MVNVHAAGGAAMMRAAMDAAREDAGRRSMRPPLVIAVTMLTSLNESNLADAGFSGSMNQGVERLARLAQTAGLDGVVASPQEIGLIRQACGQSFAIVTPGIRAAGEDRGDQTRTMSAAEALGAGATYLVVGRPIIAAPDPRKAAEAIALVS
jgi:orotidine-5'-phosphate decarboxylase